jgi:hypothetical protein
MEQRPFASPPPLHKRPLGPASRRGARTPQLAQELRAEAQILGAMASLIELISQRATSITLVKAAQELASYVELTVLWMDDKQIIIPSVYRKVQAAKKLLDMVIRVPDISAIRRDAIFEEALYLSPRLARVEGATKEAAREGAAAAAAAESTRVAATAAAAASATEDDDYPLAGKRVCRGNRS